MRYHTLERYFTAYHAYSFTFARQRSLTALTQQSSKSIGHTSHVPGYRLALSTAGGSAMQLPVYEVRDREISRFKEQWVRILSECGVSEPYWSVKWIIQHVLRGNPHNKVPTRSFHVVHTSYHNNSCSATPTI